MVGIVFLQDIRFCPYLDRYASALMERGIPYDCIWWERWETPPEAPPPPQALASQRTFVFRKPSKMARSPLLKVADFAAFALYARRIIKERKYDALIVLTTVTGMLLYDILVKQYRGRFIFDIRDISYEKLALYRGLESRLIDASAFTAVSSEGFLSVLPKKKGYVITDNFTDADLSAATGVRFVKKPEGEPIVLSYMGFIRYFRENRAVLDRLIDDPRFRLKYHGAGADLDKLAAYQKEHANGRLEVTGYFDHQRDKRALCEEADILNNYYSPEVAIWRLSTSNKAYDGLIYQRPQLVAEGMFCQQLVERWQVGVALDARKPDFPDRLYDYYQGIDEKRFTESTKAALAEVTMRDARYRQRISAFLEAVAR